MRIIFFLFVLIQLGSLTFTVAAFYLLSRHLKKFRFQPSESDLVFGFLRMRHVGFFYIFLQLFLIMYFAYFFIRHFG